MKLNEKDKEPTIVVEKVNHDVRRLFWGFSSSVMAGIILITPPFEKLKAMIGDDNYLRITVFISLFLPIFVNWIYNKLARRKIRKQEAKVNDKINKLFTQEDIETLSPADKALVVASLDKKLEYLEHLKVLKRNKEGIY